MIGDDKMDVIDTIQKGDYFAQIIPDDDTGNDSPRDWDNLGTMVCFHRNYNLGDFTDKKYREHGKGDNTFYNVDQFTEWLQENEKEIAVILPIYAYEHGNITISTGRGYPFNDLWDSGQLGYIFATKNDLREEYNCKHVTKSIKDKAERVLKAEVDVYDQYLRGDIYGYKLFKIDPEKFAEDEEFDPDSDDPEDYGEELDSCWGFYGIDSVKEEVNSMIDYYLTKETA
jgi:hypothetical protein